jgi:hypothetical protein
MACRRKLACLTTPGGRADSGACVKPGLWIRKSAGAAVLPSYAQQQSHHPIVNAVQWTNAGHQAVNGMG